MEGDQCNINGHDQSPDISLNASRADNCLSAKAREMEELRSQMQAMQEELDYYRALENSEYSESSYEGNNYEGYSRDSGYYYQSRGNECSGERSSYRGYEGTEIQGGTNLASNEIIHPMREEIEGFHPLRKAIEPPIFTGRSNDISVFNFLQALTRFQQIHSATDEQMFREVIPLVLRDHAYSWYELEMQQYPMQTFADFSSRLRKSFQNAHYTEKLRREFDRRTQAPGELLSTYIGKVVEYYKRLGEQPSDREVISRIISGLNPEYFQYIRDPSTFSSFYAFRVMADEVDNLVERANNYIPPPAYTVEPSLVFTPQGGRMYEPRSPSPNYCSEREIYCPTDADRYDRYEDRNSFRSNYYRDQKCYSSEENPYHDNGTYSAKSTNILDGSPKRSQIFYIEASSTHSESDSGNSSSNYSSLKHNDNPLENSLNQRLDLHDSGNGKRPAHKQM